MGSITRSFANNILAAGKFDGTKLTGDIPEANLSANAPAFDDNKIVNDLSTLGLRVHTQENLSASNTNSQYVDVFQDSTGITNLTDVSRNASEYMSSVAVVGGNDSNTKKLMHYNDNLTNSASGSSLAFTNNSGGTTFNTSTKKFGTHSAFFNGGNGYYADSSNYSDLNLGTGTFTIDFWFQLTGDVQNGCCYNIFSGGAGSNYYRIIYNHTSGEGVKFIADSVFSPDNQDMNWGSLATNNTWHHACIVRNSSNQIKLWKDGVLAATLSKTNAALNANSSDRNFFDDGNYDGFRGYVDEYRVSVGVDRTTDSGDPLYISSGTGFTPPTGAYGSDNTSATGSFENNAITAASSTTKMGAVITYQDNAGTNALNTDIVLQLSADNGSNYSTATLTALPDFASGIKCAKINDLSVTAGTQLKYKILFANQASGSKEARIRGVSLNY